MTNFLFDLLTMIMADKQLMILAVWSALNTMLPFVFYMMTMKTIKSTTPAASPTTTTSATSNDATTSANTTNNSKPSGSFAKLPSFVGATFWLVFCIVGFIIRRLPLMIMMMIGGYQFHVDLFPSHLNAIDTPCWKLKEYQLLTSNAFPLVYSRTLNYSLERYWDTYHPDDCEKPEEPTPPTPPTMGATIQKLMQSIKEYVTGGTPPTTPPPTAEITMVSTDMIQEIYQHFWDEIKDAAMTIDKLPAHMQNFASFCWNSIIRSVVSSCWNSTAAFFSSCWNSTTAFFSSCGNSIQSFFSSQWNLTTASFSRCGNSIRSYFSSSNGGYNYKYNNHSKYYESISTAINIMLNVWTFVEDAIWNHTYWTFYVAAILGFGCLINKLVSRPRTVLEEIPPLDDDFEASVPRAEINIVKNQGLAHLKEFERSQMVTYDVDANASLKDIKSRNKKLQRTYHPDKKPHGDKICSQLLNSGVEVLVNLYAERGLSDDDRLCDLSRMLKGQLEMDFGHCTTVEGATKWLESWKPSIILYGGLDVADLERFRQIKSTVNNAVVPDNDVTADIPAALAVPSDVESEDSFEKID